MLLTQGARSVSRAAGVARAKGREVPGPAGRITATRDNGEKVSFTDRYLQPQIGTIARLNRKRLAEAS